MCFSTLTIIMVKYDEIWVIRRNIVLCSIYYLNLSYQKAGIWEGLYDTEQFSIEAKNLVSNQYTPFDSSRLDLIVGLHL